MLLGYTPLPFEENPALFQNIGIPPNAQNMLRQMLQRNPAARPGLSDVSPCSPQLVYVACRLRQQEPRHTWDAALCDDVL